MSVEEPGRAASRWGCAGGETPRYPRWAAISSRRAAESGGPGEVCHPSSALVLGAGAVSLIPLYRAAFQPLAAQGLRLLPRGSERGLWPGFGAESPEPCSASSPAWLCGAAAGPRPTVLGLLPRCRCCFLPGLGVPFPRRFSPARKCLCRTEVTRKTAAKTAEGAVLPGFLHRLQTRGEGLLRWGFGSSAPPAGPRARARGQPGFLF